MTTRGSTAIVRAAVAGGCAALLCLLAAQAADSRTLVVDNTARAGGDCTEAMPCRSLADAERASLPGDTIELRAGDGTSRGYDRGIRLAAGQRLVGQASETAALPRISNADGAGIVLADGVEVSGVAVVDTAGSGISGEGVTDVVLADVRVMGSGGHGLELAGCTGDVLASGLVIADSAMTAISIRGATGDLKTVLHGVTLSSTAEGDGLFVHAGGGARIEVTIRDTTFENVAETGLHAVADGDASLELELTRSAIRGGTVGLDLDVEGSGSAALRIEDGCELGDIASTAVNLFLGQGSTADAILAARIVGTAISKRGGAGSGLRINCNGDGSVAVQAERNTIAGGIAFDHGIAAEARLGAGRLALELRDNEVQVESSALDGIRISARDRAEVCAVVEDNRSDGGSGGCGILVETRESARLALVGINTPTSSAAEVAEALEALNPRSSSSCAVRIERPVETAPAGGCRLAGEPDGGAS